MSFFKPEILSEGAWYPNGLVFTSEIEAVEYARDLYSRWSMAENHRAVPSTVYIDGKLAAILPIGKAA